MESWARCVRHRMGSESRGGGIRSIHRRSCRRKRRRGVGHGDGGMDEAHRDKTLL